MRLTPLDIRKQEFTRSFRGYEPEEVQAFLQMVSSQWEDLQDDQRHLSEKLRDMEIKLSHYEKVEEALQEALQTARESSRKALENAEQKARLIVKEAEARAEDIKREAEQERHQIKRDAAKLSGRKNEIVARLRAFLMSEMELLARYEGDDPIGFIKLLPAEEHRIHRAERALPPAEPAPDHRAPDPRVQVPAHAPPGAYEPEDEEDDELEDDAPPAPARSAGQPARPTPEWREEPPEEPRPAFREEEQRRVPLPAPEREEGRRSPRVTWHPSAPPAEEDRFAADEDDEPASLPAAPPPVDLYSDLDEDDSFDEPARSPVREEVKHGPGWTARTVISMPPGQRPAPPRPPEPDEGAPLTGADEEIAKIRRILNDLE